MEDGVKRVSHKDTKAQRGSLVGRGSQKTGGDRRVRWRFVGIRRAPTKSCRAVAGATPGSAAFRRWVAYINEIRFRAASPPDHSGASPYQLLSLSTSLCEALAIHESTSDRGRRDAGP
jgi:hypothetical protein